MISTGAILALLWLTVMAEFPSFIERAPDPPAKLRELLSRPLVKVCGLTVRDEAVACAALGVWGVGVVFAAGSPRRVDAARAAEVLSGLPAGVARVGVFVGAAPAEMAGVARRVGLTHVQVHGDADPEATRSACGLPVIHGVSVDGETALARARASAADMVLLDAAVPGRHGGTGTAFDRGVLGVHLGTDGRHYDDLYVDGGPSSTGTAGHLRMNGREVFRHAVQTLTAASHRVLDDAGLTVDDVDWLVPHQANRRILDGVAKRLGIDEERVLITVDRHANTSAASIPLALAEAAADGRLKPEQLLVLNAMGGGFTWGSALLRW